MTIRYGFIGLGNIGGPMAANLQKKGFGLVCFDKAGTAERAPAGAEIAESVADVARRCDAIFLSLPNGAISTAVVEELCADSGSVKTVIDLSTIGIDAAKRNAELLSARGIAFLDCPVSGGRGGAIEGIITLMCSGSLSEMERHRPAFEAIGKNIFHVGDEAGQGQTVKLLNNFLSATALAATSEAILFSQSQGLKMEPVLAVLNASSGRNSATQDKFPKEVTTGRFASGFHTALMAKDVGLYLDNVARAGTPSEMGELVASLWRRASDALPGSDFTEIYKYVRDGDPS